MRYLALLLVSFFQITQAAPVTIDFDGTDGIQEDGFRWNENGFDVYNGYLDGGLLVNSSFLLLPSPSDPGTNAVRIDDDRGSIVITHETANFNLLDGGAGFSAESSAERFNLHSLEMCFLFGQARCDLSGPTTIDFVASIGGIRGDGSLVQGGYAGNASGLIEFDSSWTNLQRVWIGVGDQAFRFEINQLRVDNIAVSVVPVPPAIWLFGSGLALLAARRRAIRL